MAQLLYFALVELLHAFGGLHEQRSLGADVQRPALQDSPGAPDQDTFAEGEVQNTPIVEDGGEVVDTLELVVKVSEDAT